MKKTGLFFGSFNPIHIGHLIIANHIVEHTDLDEVWLVVTPHNPHKKKTSLLNDLQRLSMVRLATESYQKLKACKIEFDLPQPNYTVNTLAVLQEKYPDNQFVLLMGEDNLAGLHKWKNYETILEYYQIYVYPRLTQKKVTSDLINHPAVTMIKAPIIELSATQIRQDIKACKNVRPMLPPEVYQYIEEMRFYK
ncbi:MAG TPA: nicotinate-nucleotide adenylyltransferase [Flavobacteriales bacterium]|jgi:nicotinate-nucleotide adenylyltransferase|nr:nicotinate-nucleotide adenylyltransferase [Flavobacteriales bacterium]